MISKIKIKDFGPIKEGCSENNGWIDIKKVTIFIGNQGSGKSTVAKLISTISWIEKALVRGDLSQNSIENDGQFKKHCEYQNIGDYFLSETLIEYVGNAIAFSYKNGKTTIKMENRNKFYLPKIMYIPAERNFISAVQNIRDLKGLPGTLYTFSDEYFKAVRAYRKPINLPINEVKFEYQESSETAIIAGDNFKVQLMHASSGFQSLVPMYIVSKYIAESINRDIDNYHSPNSELSLKEEEEIKNQINLILNNANYTNRIKQLQIEMLSSRFRYSSFLNIVEEPEQNLYPTSQQKILNSLIEFNNLEKANTLVMTTHSPYLINYLTLSVKAASLLKQIKQNDLINILSQIVPVNSIIDAKDLIIYELDEKIGIIRTLKNYEGLPSDENLLNEELEEFNELYARLLNLQQKI